MLRSIEDSDPCKPPLLSLVREMFRSLLHRLKVLIFGASFASVRLDL